MSKKVMTMNSLEVKVISKEDGGTAFHGGVHRIYKDSKGFFVLCQEISDIEMIAIGKDPEEDENDSFYEFDSSKFFIMIF